MQQVQATSDAFAAILEDGSVVTWGQSNRGGDSSEVQAWLRNVQQLQATGGAFAAVLSDGSVVTWGDPTCGGEFRISGHVVNMQAALSLNLGKKELQFLRGGLCIALKREWT